MGLDTVELVWRIEKEFSIKVPDQRWERVVTVQDMYDVIWEYTEDRWIDKAAMMEEVKLVLIDQIRCEPDEITPEKSFTSDLGLD